MSNIHTYNGFNENDWKLFRVNIGEWQDRYMNTLLYEYIDLLTQDGNPSHKFWKLHKRICADKQKPGVTLELKRSTLIQNMIELLNDGVIETNDLHDFSDELKETINFIQSCNKQL